MKQTEEEMSDAENEIRRLQEAIAVKVCYSKVAQTRLENRLTRPNEEMCQDNVQFGLQDECKQLAATTQALHDKLRQQQSVFHTHTHAHTRCCLPVCRRDECKELATQALWDIL